MHDEQRVARGEIATVDSPQPSCLPSSFDLFLRVGSEQGSGDPGAPRDARAEDMVVIGHDHWAVVFYLPKLVAFKIANTRTT